MYDICQYICTLCVKGEANLVLKEFLTRFNEKFGVPAEQPQVAYRRLDSSVS